MDAIISLFVLASRTPLVIPVYVVPVRYDCARIQWIISILSKKETRQKQKTKKKNRKNKK